MSVSTPTALIVAAPTLFRHGLLALLQEHWPRMALMLMAETTQLVDLVAAHPFTLLVVDTALAGPALPHLLAQLHQARPTQPLLVLGDSVAPICYADAALPAARSTLLTLPCQTQPHALVAAIAQWLDTPAAPLAPAPRPSNQPDPNAPNRFSLRELEVLDLVAADYCNDEIADRLCLSVRTVESHRRALLQKSGTRTLVGLATRAVREGWIRA